MAESDRPALRFGADCFSQHTDWPSYLHAMRTAEDLGYDSLWTPDHLIPTPPGADPEGPILEPYTCLAGVAAMTSRATVGCLVSPISLRQPALLVKMVTALDHVSDGRAVLAVGSGWHREEHRQYGFEFGSGFGERLDWLRQALPVMRGMLDGIRPSSSGGRYDVREAVNSPAPVQARLPILIGGSGPKVTLRLVAEYGDMCNLIGSPDQVAVAEARLVEHCEAVDRDPSQIERTVAIRQPIIRDSHTEAEQVLNEVFAHNDSEPWSRDMVGTPHDLVERCAPYVEMGYRHLIFQFLAPFDGETMERLATEVRPQLEAIAAA
ncbi:MAG: LLM class flavin-dependent oxidoreductase [Actinobacteria bacterium]|nr:LLM class flavin-dependent oxidoreductase [Actinomycetota bacterium]